MKRYTRERSRQRTLDVKWVCTSSWCRLGRSKTACPERTLIRKKNFSGFIWTLALSSFSFGYKRQETVHYRTWCTWRSTHQSFFLLAIFCNLSKTQVIEGTFVVTMTRSLTFGSTPIEPWQVFGAEWMAQETVKKGHASLPAVVPSKRSPMKWLTSSDPNEEKIVASVTGLSDAQGGARDFWKAWANRMGASSSKSKFITRTCITRTRRRREGPGLPTPLLLHSFARITLFLVFSHTNQAHLDVCTI